MKSLLDCRMAGWTGVGRYTRGLVRALAQTPGHEFVLVLAAGDEPVAPVSTSVRHVIAHGHPFSPGGMRELGTIVCRERPDVVHCLHFPTPSPVTAPLVVTLHDLTPLVMPEVMRSVLRRGIYRRLNRRAVRVADAIIVPSAHTEGDVVRLLSDAEGKTRVIPEAADDFASGPIGTVPASLLASGERYVFSMGNTKPHKDLPTLLTAFERLAMQYPELVLLLAGDVPEGHRSSLRHSALHERVRFTGRVTDDELRALYASAAVFVFPSRYEGFGLPPLEAMALGAPAVVADAASVPEVVGDAALMFQPGDAEALARAIAQVLDDDALRQQLIADGLRRAGALSWRAAADATLGVYRALVDQAVGQRSQSSS
ncbi:MAG: glycosyltransferase family 1 protein [Coriobacteriia bacterium]|nr:glycosyltransferase family 1 protein [Coriobacteriia bacterium]